MIISGSEIMNSLYSKSPRALVIACEPATLEFVYMVPVWFSLSYSCFEEGLCNVLRS